MKQLKNLLMVHSDSTGRRRSGTPNLVEKKNTYGAAADASRALFSSWWPSTVTYASPASPLAFASERGWLRVEISLKKHIVS